MCVCVANEEEVGRADERRMSTKREPWRRRRRRRDEVRLDVNNQRSTWARGRCNNTTMSLFTKSLANNTCGRDCGRVGTVREGL